MPAVNILYDAGQTVFQIDKEKGIREGVIKKINITRHSAEVTEAVYFIVYKRSEYGSAEVDEKFLFPSAHTAWDAYQRTYM